MSALYQSFNRNKEIIELDLSIVDVKANVLPIYDCTSIHAQAGVDFILG